MYKENQKVAFIGQRYIIVSMIGQFSKKNKNKSIYKEYQKGAFIGLGCIIVFMIGYFLKRIKKGHI